MIYDFDDFVEEESFDAEKFTELQGLSKKAAPRIFHIITRMKLAPQRQIQDADSIRYSVASEPAVIVRQPSDTGASQCREPLPYPEDREPEVKYATMPYFTGLNQDIESMPEYLSPVVQKPPVREVETSPSPPPPPFLDRSSHGFRSSSDEYDQRHGTVTPSESAAGSENTSDYNLSPIIAGLARPSPPSVPPRSPERIVTTATLGHSLDQSSSLARNRGRGNTSSIPAGNNPRESVGSSVNASLRSSVSDHRHERDSVFDVVSPISIVHRLSTYSHDVPAKGWGHSPQVHPLFTRPSPSVSVLSENGRLEAVALPMPGIPDGLIPVEEEGLPEPAMSLPEAEMQLGGCAISLNSSYYQFKGVCAGAVEIIQGGLGIKHIKKHVSSKSRSSR